MRLMIVLSTLLFANTALAGNAHDEAMAALKAGDEATALRSYKAITRSSPDDARAWFMLGTLELSRGKPRRAIPALKKALDKGWYASFGAYNLACAHARAGQPDQAFEALDQALAAGYNDPAHMAKDTDLASIQGLDGWKERVDHAERNRNPCVHDDRYRAFDFWLGSWDVFDAQGVKVGTNVITADENACMLTERWTGRMGTGRSISYLDPADGRWHQDWVGSSGNVVHFVGGVDDGGVMVLEGSGASQASPEAKATRCSWTMNEDGSVTQHFEGQPDGNSWTTKMKLTYRPQE